MGTMQSVAQPSDGAFTADGSWRPGGVPGKVSRCVQALVVKRHEGLPTEDAAKAVREAGVTQAFPNLENWERASSWALARTSTSAEEAVKRAGLGPLGHWCGERWWRGSERDCKEPRHWQKPTPEEVARLVQTLSLAFSEERPHLEAPEHPYRQGDERYAGWVDPCQA